jgi:hypothetical protein
MPALGAFVASSQAPQRAPKCSPSLFPARSLLARRRPARRVRFAFVRSHSLHNFVLTTILLFAYRTLYIALETEPRRILARPPRRLASSRLVRALPSLSPTTRVLNALEPVERWPLASARRGWRVTKRLRDGPTSESATSLRPPPDFLPTRVEPEHMCQWCYRHGLIFGPTLVAVICCAAATVPSDIRILLGHRSMTDRRQPSSTRARRFYQTHRIRQHDQPAPGPSHDAVNSMTGQPQELGLRALTVFRFAR